ncbi:hypothetical protein CANARDRAFT_175984 [[Candida] arabinofermentans NRRL YB-2248]|uniref:K Homology domain-containing protein n=1 Tax=[Candida] arabinofermentans NRRL YB-2248 TaxID=983967 RepID=A0A1E4T1D9_9ASCO|nr:hypothetical protein CANARDRAFT_175984 [[Candida] arabinofermentans NRRL YB-2248]
MDFQGCKYPVSFSDSAGSDLQLQTIYNAPHDETNWQTQEESSKTAEPSDSFCPITKKIPITLSSIIKSLQNYSYHDSCFRLEVSPLVDRSSRVDPLAEFKEVTLFIGHRSELIKILSYLESFHSLKFSSSDMDPQAVSLLIKMVKVNKLMDEWCIVLFCQVSLAGHFDFVFESIISLNREVLVAASKSAFLPTYSIPASVRLIVIKGYNTFFPENLYKFHLHVDGDTDVENFSQMVFATLGHLVSPSQCSIEFLHINMNDVLGENFDKRPPTRISYLRENKAIISSRKAFEEIELKNRREKFKTRKLTKNLTFLRSEITSLIGKKGKEIEKIRTKVPAIIKIHESECSPDDDVSDKHLKQEPTQVISIIGTLCEIEAAEKLVYHHIKVNRLARHSY